MHPYPNENADIEHLNIQEKQNSNNQLFVSVIHIIRPRMAMVGSKPE